MSNIIPLRGVRGRRPGGRPVEPPPTLRAPLPAASSADAGAPVDERLRMLQNLGAAVVVILIVVGGGWIIDRLQHYSRIQACIEAGHRNCIPLKIDPP